MKFVFQLSRSSKQSSIDQIRSEHFENYNNNKNQQQKAIETIR